MILSLLLAPTAFACPTIATGTPSGLRFDIAQVAIVREEGRTTFSVSINSAARRSRLRLRHDSPVGGGGCRKWTRRAVRNTSVPGVGRTA